MAKTGYRLKNPAHPGGFVKTEIIEPLGLTVTAAARALGVTRPALSTVLNERASLSPDMAIRIEKAFGVSMETLMRMQSSYDVARAHEREDEIDVERYRAETAAKPSPPAEKRAAKVSTTVYIAPRPNEGYVVEDHKDHVLKVFKTQKEAVDWAKSKGHSPRIARVRHENDKRHAPAIRRA